ncbi:protein SIEVE ELEMENT OCCLUSION C isoform X2 [Amaranthus tricolor]|uniref:protein SIEVE ELEMENT OCCLUSION C isoform X2 n=1 Tax=Amaranthus tricolor TaxID=29722 RepID=UPI002589E375|nr:protein SIEVE ELEMENT OCCLUSION C isoform X2 [Amaranthus tricolor]
MALNQTKGEKSLVDLEADIPIKSILIMHDPDGRELDFEMLLRVIENIMHYSTSSQEDTLDISSIVEESEDRLAYSIYKISSEILSKCYGNENAHESTLSVLHLLGSYRWDDKLLLALSAFATVFGEFWVIIQAQSQNPLAASIALLKQYPNSFNMFEPIFTALNSLVKTMIEITRSVSQFERLPIRHIELQDETVSVAATKSSIYVAAYWIIRSIIVCVSLITNLRSLQDEQVHLLAFQDPYSISSAVWEIASLRRKLDGIGNHLNAKVDVCQQHTEQKMHMKLVNAFQEPHLNNQDVLQILFGQRNDLPLKHSSAQAKVDISSLKNKIVVLLISKPELLPVNELLLLVQQTYDHPLHNNLKQSFDILWVPISTSNRWSNNDITIFNLLSNSLPWYSIRQPWSLRSTTIHYAKEVWQYHEQPIMVVLDPTGMVSNINAIDMVWIWGMKAYPFSFSREEELWRNERWNLRLLLDSIDPLLTMWVEEEKSVCIYGSNKLEWVREFTTEIKNIQSLAAQLELVYVGNKEQSALACSIVSAIEREKLSHTLSMTKILLFWLRIQSVKRSRLKFNQRTDTDQILREAITLLDTCNEDNWMIFGSSSSADILKLHVKEWAIFSSRYPLWKKYLPQIGLVEAIRRSLEPPTTEPCTHSRVTTYNKEQMEETTFCDKCKRPMKKFFMYDVVEQASRIKYD